MLGESDGDVRGEVDGIVASEGDLVGEQSTRQHDFAHRPRESQHRLFCFRTIHKPPPKSIAFSQLVGEMLGEVVIGAAAGGSEGL